MDNDMVLKIADLILVRLLAVNEKGITESEIRSDLAGFLAARLSPAEQKRLIGDALEYLEGKRWLVKSLPDGKRSHRYHPNSPGMLEARLYLGADYYPKRLAWRMLKEKYLPARSLGLKINSAKEFQYVNTDGLRAECLRQAYQVPLKPFSTSTKVVAQLTATLKKARNIAPHGLRQALVEALIQTPVPDRTAAGSIQDAEWTEAEKTGPVDLAAFARDVKAAAGGATSGRYGDQKVFISHIWHAFHKKAAYADLDLPCFKKRLVDAHLANLLVLSEADLPDRLDPNDLKMSATPYLNMTFHFVRLD